MSMIKVSVIIPVYNAEHYLPMALDSILKQTLTDIEVICVDDGSTDHSLQILEKYQEMDRRIIILKQKNSYAGVARNYGMSVAKGKYLAFLDSDDYFVPEMLERAYRNGEEQGADVVIFDGECFCHELMDACPNTGWLNEGLIPLGSGFDNSKRIDGIMSITSPAPWNKIFSHEFVLNNGLKFQPYKRENDAFFVLMSLILAQKIGVVRENLVYYRRENKNSLQGTKRESPNSFIHVFIDLYEELEKRKIFDQMKKSFYNFCFSSCIWNLETLMDKDVFEKVYGNLKDNVFRKFKITELSESDFYDPNIYRECFYIMEHSPLEYWIEKYKKRLMIETKKEYIFPYNRIPYKSHILLYGGGKVGRSFYKQIKRTEYCYLDAWIDIKVREFDFYPLRLPEQVNWNDCDYIVIAIESEKIAGQIQFELHKCFGISEQKMIWENPVL